MAHLVARFALFLLGILLIFVGFGEKNDKELGGATFAVGCIMVAAAVVLIELH